MSDLDTKLKEIVELVHDGCPLSRPCPVETQAIKAIKESFAEEEDEKPMRIRIKPGKTKVTAVGELLTGQEWYKKFEKLWAESYQDTLMVPKQTIFDIAKRASGIEK